MANPVLLGANNAPQAKSMMTALTGLVEDGGRVGQIHSDRKVFTPITAVKASSSEYNGYFKIVDASKDGVFKVSVIDGATGGASTCKVNNIGFSVPAWTSEEITSNKLVVLKYTAKTTKEDATVEIVLLDALPNDDSSNCYYQIGRVLFNDKKMKIHQDHLAYSANGIAQLYWYVVCP